MRFPMYWENQGRRLVFHREGKPTARKEHQCCECGRTIQIGDEYSCFFGVWGDWNTNPPVRIKGVYKTCLECGRDWYGILEVFHENGVDEACRVFGLLNDAVRNAFDTGFLREGDRLVKKWLGIESEVDEESDGRKAVAQMRIHSFRLL